MNENQTLTKDLILVGFPQSFHIYLPFFLILLISYMLTFVGNSLLICTIIFSPKLHTPMYFFLCNLSFIDLSYSSISVPKALFDIFSKKRIISVAGCLAQVNIGLYVGGAECLLLAIMAYDRYIAICLPLHYAVIMNWRICRSLIVLMWLASSGFIIPGIIKPLIFCTENRLDHFACEMLGLLKIACGNVTYTKMAMFIEMFFSMVAPLSFIVVSYFCIIISLLKIRSNKGRAKAFSTCASHLTVVFMYYGTTMTMYMGQSKTFLSYLKYISIIYGVGPPLLNPMIYSLRNKEVREGFHYCVSKLHASLSAHNLFLCV